MIVLLEYCTLERILSLCVDILEGFKVCARRGWPRYQLALQSDDLK